MGSVVYLTWYSQREVNVRARKYGKANVIIIRFLVWLEM